MRIGVLLFVLRYERTERVGVTAGPLKRANLIADAALKHLVDDIGVLRDACEPKCEGDDVPQFKGIFVRNLATLNRRSPQQRYNRFIFTNAASILAHQDAKHAIGIGWASPTTAPSASTQAAGLDAVVAALRCSNNF